MTILVTGATGRMGSRLVPRLLSNGEHVRVLVRSSDRAQRLSDMGAEVVGGDVLDTATLAPAVKGATTVLHLAGAFHGVSEDDMVAINHGGAVAMGEAAADAGVGQFVLSSSGLIYAGGRGRPAVEGDPLAEAPNPWAASKQAAERDLLDLAARSGLPVTIARFAFVYGDGDTHLAEAVGFFATWASYERMHMLHHADVSQAILRIVRSPVSGTRIFNIADDAPMTAFELLRLHRASANDDAATTTADPWARLLDTSRIRGELGFRPIHPTLYAAQAAGAL